MKIDDFIGIFENALSENLCNEIMNHYEYVNRLGSTVSRQQDDRVSPMEKETQMYYLHLEKDPDVQKINKIFMTNFADSIWDCYRKYSEKYGALVSVNRHRICESIKIQKVKPTQGYHVWHCENDSKEHSPRILFILAYLNDVEEGGETEFLYQRLRIKPKKGTLIISPSGFTHTHRGNPPLSGDKYVINTWMEFFDQ